jgi:hypothetical protein
MNTAVVTNHSRDDLRELRATTALARTLLDEVERTTRSEDRALLAPQLADELARLATRVRALGF